MTNCPSDADYPDNPAQSGVAPRPEADALPARVVSIVRNRRRSNKPPRQNDSRPTIRLAAGDIERIVDDAEAALIKADRGLYQRANQIVFVAETPVKASRGRDVLTLRIFERGDHALREDLATSANFERYDARAKDFVSVDPPTSIVRTLKERIGRLRFPILSGVVTAPTMRDDGSILNAPGYDEPTGLLFDPRSADFPAIPDRPTRAAADKALALLCDLLKDFPFVEPHDRSVALSAVLTACVRPTLRTAPMHAFSAPEAGSGKSKLVDLASVIASGHEAPVMAQGSTEEEFEKRLGAQLLRGAPLVTIDNAERPLGGELLCQMLTQTTVQPRILGVSEVPELSASAFVAATGNNLVLRGDLTRRALLCRINPKVERPETRVFDRDPVATAKAMRPDLVVAALAILRAFHVAGRPGAPAPLGSFEEWSDLVRGALIWLGAADPVESMKELRKSDPVREAMRAVAAQWSTVIGPATVTAAEVIGRAVEMRQSCDGGAEFVHADFREALMIVAGRGGALNSRVLGNWLTERKDKIVNGFRFARMGDRQGVALWALQRG